MTAERTSLMKDLTMCLKDYISVSILQKLYKSGRWKHFLLEDFDPNLFVDFLKRL